MILSSNNVLSSIVAGSILIVLEIFKRLTIPDFVKNILQYKRVNWLKGCTIVLLMSVSITLSYFGARESVKLFTPDVILTNVDTSNQDYKARIMILEKRLNDIERTHTWQGKLTPKGQKSYNRITEQIAEIESNMLQNANRITNKNDEVVVKHTENTNTNAFVFSMITFVLDFSLLFLLAFCEYYDYRSLAEFSNFPIQTAHQGSICERSNVVATENSAEKRVFELAYKNAKANLQAYEAKLRNGEGNEVTNLKGRDRWTQELKELAEKLKLI